MTSPPRVFLHYDQAALDAAYDQARWAPNRDQVIKRYEANSEATRARLGPPHRFAYGPSPIEALDVYPTRRPNAPIQVFIHGGAWHARPAKTYAFLAELFVRAGAHFVAPDFAGVEDVDGSLTVVADQVRRAVAWVHANAASFGGDPARLYVSGHSSGAHLAGVLLTTDWKREFGLPGDLLKAGLCSSGMFDLEAVRRSARNAYVKFDDTVVHALSPQRHLERIGGPLIVSVGSHESPEFQRQAREFAAALEKAGKPVRRLHGEGYNHFEIMETLASPYGLLGRAVLEQMQLAAP